MWSLTLVLDNRQQSFVFGHHMHINHTFTFTSSSSLSLSSPSSSSSSLSSSYFTPLPKNFPPNNICWELQRFSYQFKTFLLINGYHWLYLGKSSKKKLGWIGQADRFRGGGAPPPSAWPILFVKSLGLFSYWIWFLDTQNRFYFIVKRLKNAILMYFYCLFNCPKTAKAVNIMECL